MMEVSRAPGPATKRGEHNMAEKTESPDFSTARSAARIALLDLITDTVAEMRENSFAFANQVTVTRALADAYRAIDGGPQRVEVQSK